jgi:uroporphyrinogen decarboxylase
MTPRERYLETLLFGNPDRIPFSPGGPRESTRKAWRTQGLPEDVDWFDYLCETIGVERERTQPAVDLGLDFRLIPQFEEKVLEHRDGHYVVQDWKGNVCEIADTFDVSYLRSARDFVTRRWIKCPVESRDDWEKMKERYNPDTPARLPADFAERAKRAVGRDYHLNIGWSAPFWQMREWCGFEGLCYLMADDPELVDEMAAFYCDFVNRMLDRVLPHVVPDWVQLSEDMAYKEHSMISPAMARRFLKPSYDAWVPKLKKAGVRIVDMDSDGHVGELIPIWIESGINVCDPIEVAAGNDINEFRRTFGRLMAYKGGVDKRAMAKGGRAIRAELKRIEPVVKDGGFIPSCDHGVPSDVSWPNFVDYSRLLAKMTGWL